MTERLRDLLERAVPDDGPGFDPHALAAAARRRRNRGRIAGAGLTALVLAGAAALTLTGPRDDDRDRVARDPDPYAVAACPAVLPEPGAPAADAGLDGLVGVRLCPDPAAPSADALVDVDDLPARVAAIDAFDPGRCAAIDAMVTRQSLVFAYADGRSVVVPASSCSPATVAGEVVDGGFLVDAYLDALDAQRDARAYTHPYAGGFDCAAIPAPTAARPGRETITSGAACRDFGEGPAEPLTAEQVASIADAWAHPEPLRLAKCVASDQPPMLLLGTDRGDLIQVLDGCTTLTWNGRSAEQSASLPVSMAQLGLTP